MELQVIIDRLRDLEDIVGILVRKRADFKVYTAPRGRGIRVQGDENIEALRVAYSAIIGKGL